MTNCAPRRCYTPHMEVIYVDSLFFLSLLTDYLLCLLSARLSGLYLKRRRYFAAALFGAAYSVSVFLPGLGFLALPAGKAGAAVIMGCIAFGGEEHPLRCTGVFLAVSATLGGALWSLGFQGSAVDVKLLLACFVSCFGLISLWLRRRAGSESKRHAAVELVFLGRLCQFTALVDSGNCLTDPLTGARVVIVSPAALENAFGELRPLLDIADPVELLEAAEGTPLHGRLRLIPYSALGGGGMLPVFRPERLTVDGADRPDALAAISPSVGREGFQAIV